MPASTPRAGQPLSSERAPLPDDCAVLLVGALSQLDPQAWNALVPPEAPFLDHRFLTGLEQTGCAVPERGWQPLHLILLGPPISPAQGQACPALREPDDPRLANRQLLGAIPLYLRGDSWGEFIFDFAWADLARRLGKRWYPKLVSATPFTPATASKLLCHRQFERTQVADRLLAALAQVQDQHQIQCAQLLFCPHEQAEWLDQQGWLHRQTLQALWQNANYPHFDGFLATLRHDARKNIRRERRRAAELGLSLEVRWGTELSEQDWQAVYRHYLAGVDKHHSDPYLTEHFFLWLREYLPEIVVCSLARREGRVVASTFNLCRGGSLFGRYWGADEELPYLHFELCFYRLMEWAIDNGIERFEPGAGTGHKFGRGLSPTTVHAAYRIADARLDQLLRQHVAAETGQVLDQLAWVQTHGALRRDGDVTSAQ